MILQRSLQTVSRMQLAILLAYAFSVLITVFTNALEHQPQNYVPAAADEGSGYRTSVHNGAGDSQNWQGLLLGAETSTVIPEPTETGGSAANVKATKRATPDARMAERDATMTGQSCQHEGVETSKHAFYECNDQLQGTTTMDSEVAHEGKVDARVGWPDNGLMTREESQPTVTRSSYQSKHKPIRDLTHNIEFQHSQDNGSLSQGSTIVFPDYRITDTPNPNNAQLEDSDTWCYIVNKGIKFCFECPSATSATEIVVFPRATAMMTHGTRSLLPRTGEDINAADALCCYTTGLIVFGCYLCRTPPPGSFVPVPTAVDAGVWELEETGADGKSRYRKLTSARNRVSTNTVDGFVKVVCNMDSPGYLICEPVSTTF